VSLLDVALRPEGWAPKPGSRVVLLPATNPAPDAPPPPPGVWVVIDRAPEPRCWWLMPHDGESKAWSVASMGGRARDQWPAGWPGIAVSSLRLFPAALVQKALPGC
jgi:hypothetical protein